MIEELPSVTLAEVMRTMIAEAKRRHEAIIAAQQALQVLESTMWTGGCRCRVEDFNRYLEQEAVVANASLSSHYDTLARAECADFARERRQAAAGE